jgi:hypothetical protein
LGGRRVDILLIGDKVHAQVLKRNRTGSENENHAAACDS